ncbi:MAG: peptidoglycan-binding protein LysM [Saprospiraceae bacterium]|nr:MAG: peptidoglycan-binding protein LysM [Saprospiraceae bacterium]
MGLFSFLKNAGVALAGGGGKKADTPPAPTVDHGADAMKKFNDSQLAMRLTNHVVGLQLKVDNLNIEVDDDKAIVHGMVPTQPEKEKVILAVGNVAGIASVDDRMSVVESVSVPAPAAKFYEVKRGDTLSKIARDQYGNAGKYLAIFKANEPMLKDPDKIYPGQMLRIPPQEK